MVNPITSFCSTSECEHHELQVTYEAPSLIERFMLDLARERNQSVEELRSDLRKELENNKELFQAWCGLNSIFSDIETYSDSASSDPTDKMAHHFACQWKRTSNLR